MTKSNVDRVTELMRYAEAAGQRLPKELELYILTLAGRLDAANNVLRPSDAVLH